MAEKRTRATKRTPDPELRKLMERMRYEVAQELGLVGLPEDYYGQATTAQCGKFGQVLYARAKALLPSVKSTESSYNIDIAKRSSDSGQNGLRPSAGRRSHVHPDAGCGLAGTDLRHDG